MRRTPSRAFATWILSVTFCFEYARALRRKGVGAWGWGPTRLSYDYGSSRLKSSITQAWIVDSQRHGSRSTKSAAESRSVRVADLRFGWRDWPRTLRANARAGGRIEVANSVCCEGLFAVGGFDRYRRYAPSRRVSTFVARNGTRPIVSVERVSI